MALEYGDFHLLTVYVPNGGAGPVRLRFESTSFDHVMAAAMMMDNPRMTAPMITPRATFWSSWISF